MGPLLSTWIFIIAVNAYKSPKCLLKLTTPSFLNSYNLAQAPDLQTFNFNKVKIYHNLNVKSL